MNRKLILFLFGSLFSVLLSAQTLSQPEVLRFTEECDDLVAYLQFTLNAIGDNDLSPKEKDIIISDSYAKLFRDAKVQIEDDLVPDREAVTNKDVQAYLKDVDFFFEKVLFEYKILAVELLHNEKEEPYFKIRTLRSLSANTIDNDSIHNEQVRYIEVAIDANLRELKIVSIYTTKLNEFEENIKWWNALSVVWKEILAKETLLCGAIPFSNILEIQLDYAIVSPLEDSLAYKDIEHGFCDSLGMNFIQNQQDTLWFANKPHSIITKKKVEKALLRVLNIKELDLSKRLDITDLEPLAKLSSLSSLNLSYTLVNDLYPIRNLINLNYLNISNTQVRDLDALVYSMALRSLNLSFTKVYSLDPISNLSRLNVLYFSNTHVDDIDALGQLALLNDIKMENTMVSDLSPLAQLAHIHFLDLDNSPISSIEALSDLQELKTITCNNTMIAQLDALSNLESLQIIRCENTEITSLDVLNDSPKLSKIYCGRTLQKWFESLDEAWLLVFREIMDTIEEPPTKEQLHQMANIAEIDISHNPEIQSLEALVPIKNLKVLNAAHTQISSLEPLYNLQELQRLALNNTPVVSIAPLENISTLKELNISSTNVAHIDALYQSHSLRNLYMENTNIRDISPLLSLGSMKKLYADGALFDSLQIIDFILKNPNCLVVYQSDKIMEWWDALPQEWKNLFVEMESWNAKPCKEQLHQLVKRRELYIENQRGLGSLEPLSVFSLLRELKITGSQVDDIQALGSLYYLEYFDISQNPIADLSPLASLANLETIILANTAVKEAAWLLSLTKVKHLDINGTPIKSLKPLNDLYLLETLIAYNTRITNLKPLDGLISLKSLKIYNTKISARKAEQFKLAHPSCVVDYF
ncbi:MAG: hypothetical protein B7C24_00865 [Bacteroidetes bacterium 4572_77]|nr:MAG: hypothetical protein B7C24_00865 [Bacteroidetes bacterium 4572_77]